MLDYISEKELNLSRYPVYGGYESRIYTVDGDSSYLLYKKFDNTSENNLKNKEQKLHIIHENKTLRKYSPELLNIVRDNEHSLINGYVMTKVIGCPLEDLNLSSCEKINILYNVKRILKSFVENDIYYFDLSTLNIIIRRNENDFIVNFVDIDNIVIQGYSSDVFNLHLQKYFEAGGKKDQKAMIYSFNNLTYDFLSKNITGDMYSDQTLNQFIIGTFVPKVNSINDTFFLVDYINDNPDVKKRLI